MTRGLLLLLFALGCQRRADPGVGWRLVGAYDGAALLALGEGDARRDAWEPTEAMTRSCGPVKHPDGLGFFEAEAIVAGHTPALALLVERTGDAPLRPLTPADIRVSLGSEEGPTFPLQPMVASRRLGVIVAWDGADGDGSQALPPEVGLVLTQLQAELCLEHKTGRAWIGGTRPEIRQAYLLDQPAELGGVPPDRRFFVGQGRPVPAMAGPPDACLTLTGPSGASGDSRDRAAGKGTERSQGNGQGSLDLTNTDIWGARLRECVEGSELPSYDLPLRLSDSQGQAPARPPSPRRALWVGLDLNEAGGPLVSLELDGVPLLERQALYADRPPSDAEAEEVDAVTQERALVDLLARVPLEYPALSPPGDKASEDPYRYTLLLIPNWQLGEGVGAVAKGKNGGHSGGQDAADAVGWVLRHPESLYVQVSSRAAGSRVASEPEIWWNLSEGIVGESWAPRGWGYTLGHLLGRAPIVLPGVQDPSWPQALEANRARAHSLALIGATGLLLMLARGLRRIRDLWATLPEERVTWWPGVRPQVTPPKPDALGKGEGG